MDDLKVCPICKLEADIRINHDNMVYRVDCQTCGKFLVTHEAVEDYFKSEKYYKTFPKISAYLKNRTLLKLPMVTVFNGDYSSTDNGKACINIEEIIQLFPKMLSERQNKALINLSKLSDYAGSYIEIQKTDYAMFFAESNDGNAMFFMLKQLFDEKYIEARENSSITILPNNIRLTAKGWNRIAKLESGEVLSPKQVFVAMWFDNSMDSIYFDAIREAIEKAGYESLRIKEKEHNEKICDEIVKEIKRSKFLVCDFTGHRGSVYFEAGFAMGLGKPIIWSCRKDYFKDCQFDTRQYNHIEWENAEELYKKLLNRIQATI